MFIYDIPHTLQLPLIPLCHSSVHPIFPWVSLELQQMLINLTIAINGEEEPRISNILIAWVYTVPSYRHLNAIYK